MFQQMEELSSIPMNEQLQSEGIESEEVFEVEVAEVTLGDGYVTKA